MATLKSRDCQVGLLFRAALKSPNCWARLLSIAPLGSPWWSGRITLYGHIEVSWLSDSTTLHGSIEISWLSDRITLCGRIEVFRMRNICAQLSRESRIQHRWMKTKQKRQTAWYERQNCNKIKILTGKQPISSFHWSNTRGYLVLSSLNAYVGLVSTVNISLSCYPFIPFNQLSSWDYWLCFLPHHRIE